MISDGDKVQVYEVDGKAVKVFKDPNEPKSVVLYEALTHTRVEETGYNKIPALEEVTKIDGKWAISYYNYYSYNTWGAAATYHLCIDSSVLGIDGTVDFIRQFVKLKLQLP